ncbi:porin [Caballeronia sp. SBC1]|uniref:porin n=1 Tax=Caballeronia sp. SBC1 TaxID=2705548 RepID=UPI001FB6BC10|nr:porin [Caballeronia sp. SBC1]
MALAIASTVAAPAFAQSSGVTLYGIVEDGLTFVNNSAGKKLYEMQSGVIQGSRWGLKGSEDLGGGLKTLFQIESGFDLNTGKLGQGNLGFGRQAYVGLSSEHLGMLTLGRQYDLIVDFVGPTTFNGNWGGYFAHAGDIDNTNNAFRVNNTIKYTSLNYGGLQFGGMYAPGGVAGSFGANSTIAAGASYSHGPLYVGAGYFYARNPATQFPDGNWQANSPIHQVNQVGPFGYVGHPGNEQIIGVGGTYAIGSALLGLDYTNTRFDDANGTTSSVTFNNYEAWAQYAVTPAATLGAGYTFTEAKVNYNGQKPKYNQINVLADYRLSKRTDVYMMGVYQRASGGANADIYDGFLAQQSSNNSQTAVRIGIRHTF